MDWNLYHDYKPMHTSPFKILGVSELLSMSYVRFRSKMEANFIMIYLLYIYSEWLEICTMPTKPMYASSLKISGVSELLFRNYTRFRSKIEANFIMIYLLRICSEWLEICTMTTNLCTHHPSKFQAFPSLCPRVMPVSARKWRQTSEWYPLHLLGMAWNLYHDYKTYAHITPQNFRRFRSSVHKLCTFPLKNGGKLQNVITSTLNTPYNFKFWPCSEKQVLYHFSKFQLILYF